MKTEETNLYIQSEHSKNLHRTYHGARLSMELICAFAKGEDAKRRGDKVIMCLKTGRAYK